MSSQDWVGASGSGGRCQDRPISPSIAAELGFASVTYDLKDKIAEWLVSRRNPQPASISTSSPIQGPARLDQRSALAGALRGLEQQLIGYYRSQGISASKINGISPRNPNLGTYLQQALKAFGGSDEKNAPKGR